MENKKAESLIEALKIRLTESYGSNKIKEIYEQFKKLRSTIQKCKTKVECIKEIKDDSIKTYLDESEEESIKKDKIDLLTKTLQKTCQRMEDEIKLLNTENLNNSAVSENANANIYLNLAKMGKDNKLDEEINKVFLEKIKLFEETFLNLSNNKF